MDITKPDYSKITIRFVVICFVLGLLIGTTGDFVHILTGIDKYPSAWPFPYYIPFLPVDMPVWVPFLFGTAVLLLAIVHKIIGKMNRPRMHENRDLALAAPLLFVGLYALTGFIDAGTGSWQDAWIGAVAVVLWFVADRTLTGAVMALIVAVIGTGFEMFLVHTGVFEYLPGYKNFFGVPSWLPSLYLSASICISLFVRWVR